MDLLQEVKAIDEDPDRLLSLIERAKAKDDEAVKLLFFHALYLKVKRNKAIPVRRKPVMFDELRNLVEKNTRLDISYV
jgi:hypothetical protein